MELMVCMQSPRTTCWLIQGLHLQVSPQKKLNPRCPLLFPLLNTCEVDSPLPVYFHHPTKLPGKTMCLKAKLT